MVDSKSEEGLGRTILLVDDDPHYLDAMQLVLEREGYRVLTAHNGRTTLEKLRQCPVDLLLLDYFMPDMTGEEVVVQLRQFNPYVQVILQTGYARERPPRDMLRRLNIQGYYDKGESLDKFLLWVDVGLKAASTVQFLNTSRHGLRHVLDCAPVFHKIQPLEDLYRAILEQVVGLFNRVEAVALSDRTPSAASGMLVTLEDETQLMFGATLGRFAALEHTDQLEPEVLERLREALRRGELEQDARAVVLPLRVGGLLLGAVYLEWPGCQRPDAELLQMMASQAALSIQNIQLYQMATLDPLTGVYVRRFFEQWLMREVRAAFRLRQPLALLMVDMDGLKFINDTGGHLAGDQALAELGGALRRAVRTSDIVGRYGGDEFAVILPGTPPEGAAIVADRILEQLRGKSVQTAQGPLSLASSLGLGALESPDFEGKLTYRLAPAYFQMMAQKLILCADEALYQAKRNGGSRLCQGEVAKWQPPADGGK